MLDKDGKNESEPDVVWELLVRPGRDTMGGLLSEHGT